MRSLAQVESSVKPTGRVVIHVRIPPLAFRDFSWWPAVRAVYDSPVNSVLVIDLGHSQAASTLAALRLLGGQRVELN